MRYGHIAHDAGIGLLGLLVVLSMGLCGCRRDSVSGDDNGGSTDSVADATCNEKPSVGTRGGFRPSDMLDEKPIVYLYPKDEIEVKVSVEHLDWLTCTYPETDGAWTVVAEPDGTLMDQETGRLLYALYYEATTPIEDFEDEGFVVSRDDLVPFLEEKLSALGLTEREAEEMIVYWLPQMQSHDRCLIRFLLTDAEQKLNRLDVSPVPDHLIRIRMIWKGYDEGETIPLVSEQELTPVDRPSLDGFVAVEWGGTELR